MAYFDKNGVESSDEQTRGEIIQNSIDEWRAEKARRESREVERIEWKMQLEEKQDLQAYCQEHNLALDSYYIGDNGNELHIPLIHEPHRVESFKLSSAMYSQGIQIGMGYCFYDYEDQLGNLKMLIEQSDLEKTLGIKRVTLFSVDSWDEIAREMDAMFY